MSKPTPPARRRLPDVFGPVAYTHRKEYARWIDEAKREQTRQRRVTEALEMLRQGRTRT